MDGVLNTILNERQLILIAICRYLALDAREKTAHDIFSALTLKGLELNSKSSVLYKYLRFLEKKELVRVKIKGKTKYFSIASQNDYEQIKIGKEDIPFLEILKKSLENYSNLPLTDELNQLIQKSKQFKDFDFNFKAIELDSTHNHIHSQYLSFFYYRILDSETVNFHYKKFENSMSQEVELEPYLLKEHNKRWYLIGKIPMKQNDNTNYLTYALDRIVSIHWEKPSREFIRDQSFNPEIYWEHSVGLFRGEPKKVTFQLKNDFMNNIDFIKTSPIHKSQKITKIDEQWIEVELFIYPSYELVRELRKFGVNNIRNLKPESIQI
jgi:hypothetical protein